MTVMPIEWGKVREYALATGNMRTEYLDDPNAPIPPTFLATVVFWATIGGGNRSAEAERLFAELGITPDLHSLLSLEQEYVFHPPLPRAGDEVVVTSRPGDTMLKHGRRGPMVLVKNIVEFSDRSGRSVAECTYTSAYFTDVPAT
jgi:hypothetical protein